MGFIHIVVSSLLILAASVYFLYYKTSRQKSREPQAEIVSREEKIISSSPPTTGELSEKSQPMKKEDKSSSEPSKSSSESKSAVETTTQNANSNNNQPLDAWEERRRRGVPIHSLHEKKDIKPEEKPFGSSYYYAHNNTRHKGGYADGLRMEDYTMNKPRLLSKSGSNFSSSDSLNAQDSTALVSETIKTQQTTDPAPTKPIVEQKRKLQILKYLWDDPGNEKGEGTIRIDSLPKNSTETFPWQDANVSPSDVSAELINDDKGLLVQVVTPNVDYVLKITELYAPVSGVKTIVKAKRLLVKLTKKPEDEDLDIAYLDAWPHPHKKKK